MEYFFQPGHLAYFHSWKIAKIKSMKSLETPDAASVRIMNVLPLGFQKMSQLQHFELWHFEMLQFETFKTATFWNVANCDVVRLTVASHGTDNQSSKKIGKLFFCVLVFFLWLWLKSEVEEESVLLTFTLLLIWNSKMCMKKVILIWYPDFGASDRLPIWH